MLSGMPVQPDVTEWIECSWTAYVSEPAAELPIELGVRPDLPQFTFKGVDPSFLADAYTLLQGKTGFDVAREYQDRSDALQDRARQVATAVVIPNELTVQVLVYPERVSALLAALDEARIVAVAYRWRDLLWPVGQREAAAEEPPERRLRREANLRELVRLGREAVARGRRLMVRVEFRRCRKDPETGRVERSVGTRH